MPFLGADLYFGYVRQFRCVWFDGKYGSGKTALAMRTALQLCEMGVCRYILSNLQSPLVTRPADVELRPGVRGAWHADAAIVLDEAGTFIKSTRDSDGYLAALRKLNVILLLPSVEPLPPKLARLVVERTYDWGTIGLPFWQYALSVTTRKQKEATSFFWRSPSEIYGIYDTIGYPTDDNEIKEYLNEWTKKLAVSTGYKAPVSPSTFRWVSDSASGSESGNTENSASMATVEALGRLADALETSTQETSLSLSLFRDIESGKKRRKR